MRANVEPTLKIPRVQDGRQHLVPPVAKSVQNPQPDIVHARLHAAVERRRAPVVVALHAPRRMHRLVEFAVVRLLEHLEGADADLVQHPEILHRQRGGVHVHAADPDGRARLRRLDRAVVAGLDGLGDVFRGGRGMFAIDGDEPLVSDAAGEHVHLLLQLVHRQHAALLQIVAVAEAAVLAPVHAEVRDVERRERHDAVVVHLVFDAVRRRAHLLEELLVRDAHQRRRLGDLQRLAGGFRLREDLADADGIDGLRVRLRQRPVDQIVVDEMPPARQVPVDFALHDEVLRVVGGVLEMPYVK